MGAFFVSFGRHQHPGAINDAPANKPR